MQTLSSMWFREACLLRTGNLTKGMNIEMLAVCTIVLGACMMLQHTQDAERYLTYHVLMTVA